MIAKRRRKINEFDMMTRIWKGISLHEQNLIFTQIQVMTAFVHVRVTRGAIKNLH